MWHVDINWKKTTNYSNIEIYNKIMNEYGENINTNFWELVLFMEQVKEFCISFPEFQLPFDFDENWYNNDEYKKWIIFEIIK